MFKFANIEFLLLLPVLVYLFLRKNNGAIKVPGIDNIKKYGKNTKKHWIGKFFIFLSLVFMTIALARPQEQTENKQIKKNGIDIVISLDLSRSMLQQDFSPNRLEKAKEILQQFINKRGNDRISLVVFGGDAYTKVPLTFDHSVVKDITSKISVNDITSNNRTAIGMGLGVALNRLKNSNSKSKVVILMTDGENNSGEMSPLGATQMAKEMGIKVYTVGIGARENEIDENLLQTMADESNGRYFRARNQREFSEIFNEIDRLEKSSIESRNFYDIRELYEPLLKLALIFLVIGVLFQYFIYIIIP
ncbi:VWA domain-containing protein [Cetobacterium sp. 2A]|uniref:VWA domain-containing protein n=1 Tax=unclassified Cetobacterium TaxID=2630983 RepID=UPI00163C0E75|nr:VWA domain-containing protein [Cetobacterium sp. 2A]MBC2855580.1 VWA domain-containing protein [Cetobacterium sp. 2A]